MAKSKVRNRGVVDSDLPEGFEASQERAKGWVIWVVGNVVQGYLRRRIEKKWSDYGGFCYEVELTRSCHIRDINNEEITAPSGSIVMLDEKGYVKHFADLISNGKRIEIFVKIIEKEEGQEGKWICKTGKRIAEVKDSDDNVPF